MDPNSTLEQLRARVRHLRTLDLVDELSADLETYVVGLLDGVEALDEWLSRGGFPPDAWRRGVTTTALVDEIQRELNARPTWRRDDLTFYQRQRDDGPPPPPTQEAP